MTSAAGQHQSVAADPVSGDALAHSFDPRLAPLAYAFALAAAAIVVDRWLGLPIVGWLIGSVVALAVWFFARRATFPPLRHGALLAAFACLAGGWHHANWFLFAANDLGNFAGDSPRPVVVEAVALGDCRHRPEPPSDPLRTIPQQEETRLRLAVKAIRNGSNFEPAAGKCELIVSGNLQGVRYGDRLRVSATLVKPDPPKNPGEFDYASFLRARGELCWLQADLPESVTIIQPGASWSPMRWLHATRSAGLAALERSMNPAQQPLAAAVLFGAREELTSNRVERFFESGSVHLLAISGLHVGILAAAIWFVASLLPIKRRTVLAIVMAFVVGYALLTDSRPPVVRAAVLVASFCLSQWRSRPTNWLNVLSLAGLIVLAINPSDLFQAGAQLSFLAVASLAGLSPLVFRTAPPDPLDRLIENSRPWWMRTLKAWREFVWRLFLIGVLIWVISLPLVMWRFHLVSPIALVINPLLIPLMGFALICGLAAALTTFVIPPVGMLAGMLCGWFLGMIEAIVRLSVDVPGSHFWTPGPAAWFVAAFYLAALLWVLGWRPLARLSPTSMVALAACWFAISFACNSPVVSRRLAPRNELRLTFLSVGHGTSVCVELPGGKTFLYDAGRLGSHKSGVRIISAFLWSRNKSQLDGVLVSHADADHYNAVPGLLAKFPTVAVYQSPVMYREESPALGVLASAIEESGATVHAISSNVKIATANGVSMQILHPPPAGVVGGDNANSIVLAIEYEGRRVLLPGDLEGVGLRQLLARPNQHYDVVMAPHHGSIRSHPFGTVPAKQHKHFNPCR